MTGCNPDKPFGFRKDSQNYKPQALSSACCISEVCETERFQAEKVTFKFTKEHRYVAIP